MADINFNPALLAAFNAAIQNKTGPLAQRAPLEETEEQKRRRMQQEALRRMTSQQMIMKPQSDGTSY